MSQITCSPTDPAVPEVGCPLRSLTADLPRDQALGLRIIALARAAAAVHMAEAASRTVEALTGGHGDPSLARSQAAKLLTGATG